MKFIHCSDIHLNFCTFDQTNGGKNRKGFLQRLDDKISQGASFILLTGDITESPYITSELYWLAENIHRPLYYVLGNHDHWYTNFKTSKYLASISQTINKNKKLYYLSANLPFEIQPKIWITGVDGWYDCRNFKYNEISDFISGSEALNDFDLIEDLITLKGTPEEKLQLVRDFADIEVYELEHKLKYILSQSPNKIIVGTHVPPLIFPNSKVKENYPGFYSCRKLMDLLCQISEDYKNTQFYVYCGHNHGGGSFEIDNLHIFCKESRYSYPDSVLVEI